MTPDVATRRSTPLGGAALVFAGGALGTLLRAGLQAALGAGVGLWVGNVAGALLLGALLGCCDERHERWRLFLGTGVLGSFTTYSALAMAVVTAPTPAAGVALGLGQVALGVAAAWLGSTLGSRLGSSTRRGPA